MGAFQILDLFVTGGASCPLCGTSQSKSSPGLKEVVPSMGIGCSLLQKADGPFAGCHAHVDPAPYFHSCLTDQCVFEGDSAAICRSMKAYADICQRLGGKLEYWRGVTHCREYSASEWLILLRSLDWHSKHAFVSLWVGNG